MNLPSFQKNLSPILSSFNFLEKAELASIAYNIQGNLNEFRETINKESPDLVPEAEVEWVTSSDKESFFSQYKGKVIVRMKPSKDNARNLAKAIMIQVSKGVIPESRIYVDQEISRSIDLTLVKKILVKQNQENALRFYTNEILNPALTEKKILTLVEAIDAIDEVGFLTRLYVRELGELPKKHGLRLTGLSGIRKETSALLKFVSVIATREREERVPLTFEGRFLKTGIVLVSEKYKFETRGIAPYVLAAITNAKKGADLIYIVAYGAKISNALEVVQYLVDNLKMELVKQTVEPYKVVTQKEEKSAICAVLRVRSQNTLQSGNQA